MKLRIAMTVSRRLSDGSLIQVEFGGLARAQGTEEQIGEMLLEAERHGNDGRARVWIQMIDEAGFLLLGEKNIVKSEIDDGVADKEGCGDKEEIG